MKSTSLSPRAIGITVVVFVLVIAFAMYKGCFGGGLSGGLSNDASEIIPDDIAVVMAADMPQMLRESDFESIRLSESFKQYISQAAIENAIFAELMKDPVSAGIDLVRRSYFALDRDTTQKLEHFSAVIIPLADGAAFDKIAREFKSPKREIKNKNGYKSYEVDQLTILGWSDDYILFGASQLIVDLEARMARFFNVPPAKSISKNRTFRDAMQGDGDILFWVSTTPFASDPKILNTFGMAEMSPKILEGNSISGEISFNRGSISGLANFHMKASLGNLFENIFKSDQSSDFARFVPAKDLSVVMYASLNLPAIYNRAINDPKAQKYIESQLAKIELSVDDFYRALDGEIMIVSFRESIDAPAKVLIGAHVDNEGVLNRFIDVGLKNGFMLRDGNDVYKMKDNQSGFRLQTKSDFPDGQMRIAVVDDYLFFVTDLNALAHVMGGGYKGKSEVDDAFLDVLNDQLLGGHVDISKMSSIKNANTLSFESLHFTLDQQQLNFNLELSNKNEYALKQIFDNDR